MNKRTGPWKSVKSGNVNIPIYRTANPKAADGWEYKVAFYVHEGEAKHRRVKTFADPTNAEKFASNVNAAIVKGDANSLTLTGEECHAYRNAIETLRPSGVPLMRAAAEYADAFKKLVGVPLAVAIDGYLRAFGKMKKKSVRAVVDELIEYKRTNKRKPASAVYLKDLESRLGKFAGSFQMDIDEVTPVHVEDFLAGLKGSGRTQFNYGRVVRTLFNFAEGRHYLPKEGNPFDSIELDFEDDSEIEIFTPAELRKILKAARPELVPFLAIGAFAGLRHEEIKRLDWSEVGKENIEVKAGKAKTRSRRLVPIQPNLAAWLEPHCQKAGPVVKFAHTSKQIGWLVDDINGREKFADSNAPEFQWKHNALRHSFISYRMAAVKSAATVALEAGNSETMIFQHYRELVKADDAAEWFLISPA